MKQLCYALVDDNGLVKTRWWNYLHLDNGRRTKSFWAKVNKTDGCWLWTGARSHQDGYGRCIINRQDVRAHRVSYFLHFGEISEGQVIHHKCHNRLCVRPDHLEALRHSAHIAQHHARQATPQESRTHCRQGHRFDETSTYVRPDRYATKTCRICRRESVKRYKARKKAGAK